MAKLITKNILQEDSSNTTVSELKVINQVNKNPLLDASTTYGANEELNSFS